MTAQLLSTLPHISALLFMGAGLSLMLRVNSLCKRLLVLAIIVAILNGLKPAQLQALAQWLGQLPTLLLILIAGFSLLGILGEFARLFIGRHATDSMVGDLAAGLVRMLLRIIILPARGLGRIFQDRFGR